jgi:hypothetical protein
MVALPLCLRVFYPATIAIESPGKAVALPADSQWFHNDGHQVEIKYF